MSVKERLITFVNTLNISQRAFERSIELSHGYISNMVNSIQPDKLERIVRCYPQLSPGWLMTGEGEMLKPGYIKKDKKKIEVDLIPVLPISAEAGSFNNFEDSVMLEDCEMMASPVKDADFAIAIGGDSMYPEYPSGSKVLVKKINEMHYIEWGKVFVLDTYNGGIIKKLMPPDDKSISKVKCVSINPEYPPFEVELEYVRGIYKVLYCLSKK